MLVRHTDVAVDYKSYQSAMTNNGELNVKMSHLTC